MPTLEINGRKVEVDDSFLSLSPQEQEAQVEEIASSLGTAPKHQAAPAHQQAPEVAAPPVDPQGYVPPPANDPATDAWVQEQERQFQQGQPPGQTAPGATPGAPPAKADEPWISPNFLDSAFKGMGDTLSFGFLDEATAGLGTILPGSKTSIWDGKGFGEAYDENVKFERDKLKQAQEDSPGGYILGGIGGALAAPVGVGGTAFRAAKNAPLLTKLAKGAGEGAVQGAIYGFGSDEGGVGERLDGAAMGGATGAAAGAVLAPAMHGIAGLSPAVRRERFANTQLEKNPYAAFDAEVVEDLAKLTSDRAVTKVDPKGRAQVTAKAINNLEQSYQLRFKDMINGLDISTAEKTRLKAALDADYSMSLDELAQIRGTTEGDAVADAIVKTQRLRALTPELRRNGGKLLNSAANVTDMIPGIPGITGRGLRALSRATGEGEAARVNAADSLIAKRKAYSKLQEATGPSGQRESQQALWEKYKTTVDGKDASAAERKAESALKPTREDMRGFRVDISGAEPAEGDIAVEQATRARRAAEKLLRGSDEKLAGFDEKLNAPVPEAPITRADRKKLTDSISDLTPDPRDIRDTTPTDARLASRIQARDRALSKMESDLNSFDQKFATPKPEPKQAKVKAPKTDPAQDAIDDAISKGLPGESGTQAAFASRLGVPVKDMLRALDKVAEDVPDLAGDIARIKHNYPTKRSRLGPVLTPRLRKVLEEDGTMARVAEEREAAAARKAASEAEAPVNAIPAKPGEIPAVYRSVETASIPQKAGEPMALDIAAPPAPTWKSTDEGITPAQRDFAKAYEAWSSELDKAAPDKDAVESLYAYKEAAATRLDTELAQRPQIRPVDRPLQWQDGKDRYVNMANDAINDLYGNLGIGDKTMSVIKRVPEQIRDQFKTTEEAVDWINNEIRPDLMASGASSSEVDAVLRHLRDIADQKPYKTKEAFDAGTRARRPGRPRKD